MKPNYSKFLLGYMIFIGLIGLAVFMKVLLLDWSVLPSKFPEIIIAIIALSIGYSLYIRLPRQRTSVTIYYPFLIFGILILKEAVVFAVVIAYFISSIKDTIRTKDLPFKPLDVWSDYSAMILVSSISAFLYLKFGGTDFNTVTQVPWTPFFISVLALPVTEQFLSTIYSSLRDGVLPWKRPLPLITFIDLPLTPLAIPAYLVYRHAGTWAFLALVLPISLFAWLIPKFLHERSKKQEALEHLTVANELIRSSLNVKEMLQQAALKIQEIINPAGIEIFLLESGGWKQVLALGEGPWKTSAPPSEFFRNLEKRLPEKIPITISDTSGDSDFLDYNTKGFLSLLIIPLVSGEEISGYMIASGRTLHYFAEGHLEFAKVLAAPLSQALYAARLHAQLAITLKELQETQTQLVQSEKMAGLGKLVAGVAHELNNPLNFISMQLPLMEARFKELQELTGAFEAYLPALPKADQDLLTELEKSLALSEMPVFFTKAFSSMKEGTNRCKRIIDNLRTFARTETVGESWDFVDINEAIDSTLILLTSLHENRVTLHKEYGNIPKVWCNAPQINQVFMNLLNNAFDAIPETGDVWIKTEVTDGHCKISIRDSGQGIPDEIKARIFDPFFTTKEVGKGTGLGLSIVYSIIQQHKGQITVESKPGAGTTFIVILPQRSVEFKSER